MSNLFEVLDEFFNKIGFEKINRRWFKKINDGFIVCEFQRFRFDLIGSGFLNFGIVFPALNAKKIRVPKGESTWNLRGRYKSIAELPTLVENFPITLDTPEKLDVVYDATHNIEKKIIPYLERYTTIENILQDIENDRFDFAKLLTSITSEDLPKVVNSR